MPTSASSSAPTPQCAQRPLTTLLRDLGTTVALCYLITLALLRCIALHLDFFGPPVTCAAQNHNAELVAAYQEAIDNVSQVDVLRITTGCSFAAFAALELCLLLARRARCGGEGGQNEGDAERGLVKSVSYPPEKLPQK
ncbi:hypothetical protein DFH06DRAFT_1317631 [Mycena polygramma]|nr:hypothetical protein DFH06DRAFT_1317631 [Mycena polygramma]